MVQSLFNYVRQLQRQGYSSQAIKSNLLRLGYSLQDINYAFAGISRSSVLSSKKMVIFLVLFVVILFALIFYFVFVYSSVEISVKLVAPVKAGFFAGEMIMFEKTITSSKIKTGVDVHYEVRSSSGNVITQKNEKLLISGVSNTQSRILIPQNAVNGVYSLKIVVAFDGRSVSDVFYFVVSGWAKELTLVKSSSNQSESVEVECITPCVDVNPCVKGSCVSGVCKFEPLYPCCGNGKCDSGEDEFSCSIDCVRKRAPQENVVYSAMSVVKKERVNAVLLCNSLIEDVPVDDCLVSIANEAKNSGLCNSIRVDDSRDACYMNFALDGDSSVCDKIVSSMMVHSCVYVANAKNSEAQLVLS